MNTDDNTLEIPAEETERIWVYVDWTFWALPIYVSVQSYGVAFCLFCFHVDWVWKK